MEKMTILTMKAFGDFDAEYDINLCIGDNEKIGIIRNALNSFCKTLPGCGQDIALAKYLNDYRYTEELTELLFRTNQFTLPQAKDFVKFLHQNCGSSSVFVYEDTFGLENITQI